MSVLDFVDDAIAIVLEVATLHQMSVGQGHCFWATLVSFHIKCDVNDGIRERMIEITVPYHLYRHIILGKRGLNILIRDPLVLEALTKYF